MEDLWIIGDEFVARSGHIIEKKQGTYVNANFQVTAAGGSIISSNIPSVLTRMRNVLIKLINKLNVIPKIVVIVAENDISKDVALEGFGSGKIFDDEIKWLFEEHASIIAEYKKYLPARASKHRENWPYFLWISPSLHDNYIDNEKRKRFTKSLETLARKEANITTLRVKDTWMKNDNSLFTANTKRYASTGWNVIWTAIDSAIQHFDTKIIQNIEESLRAKKYALDNTKVEGNRREFGWNQNRHTQNRHWVPHQRHHGQPERRLRLPTPPRIKEK